MTKEAIEQLAAYGAVAGEIKMPGPNGVPFALIPNGYNARSLADLLPPQRVERTVRMIEAGSFCDYVNRFKNPDTLIFATVTETSALLTAIIDYHGAPSEGTLPRPEYCKHVVTLALEPTPEWVEWTRADGKRMTQVEFAEWLEANASLFNVVEGGALVGAELLELVCTLQGKSEVRFNTAVRLKDGKNSLNYEEDVGVQGQVRSATMEFPPVINAGMCIFHGSEAFRVDARLKTRIEGRKLAIWFETINRARLVRKAVLDTVAAVAAKTDIIPFIGTP